MLYLMRKVGERVVIGGEIVVEVTKIGDKRVRLGIEAPKSVSVNRQEIEDRLNDERGQQLERAHPVP